jgi:hypothetical protein
MAGPQLLREGREGPLRAVRRAGPHLEPRPLDVAFDCLDPAAHRRPAGAAELFVDRPRQPARADSGTVATHAAMWLSDGHEKYAIRAPGLRR